MALTDYTERRLRKEYYEDDDHSKGSRKVPKFDKSDDPGDVKEIEAKRKLHIMGVIESLVQSLIEKRNNAVRARAGCGIEQIWREDEMAFEGFDAQNMVPRMIDYATGSAPLKTRSSKEPKRSKVYINIVRPKCETAEGRFSDIQLPTDDKNWGLKDTPVPELVKGIESKEPAELKETGELLKRDDGSQVTIGDVATETLEDSENRMMEMEREIDDQLTECDYNGESRKAITNAVRLGTGIMKGPFNVKSLQKSWQRQEDETGVARVLKYDEDQKPASKSCSPWDIFPDPDCGEDVRKAAYMWERETILPRELRALLGVDGYLHDQIHKVLAEEPTRLYIAEPKNNQQFSVRYNTMPMGTVYEKWEYNGDLDKEDLEALGCDCTAIQSKTIGACVILVNEHPIKVTLNAIDTGEIPYDFFQWTTRTGVPWGLGVARETIWQQRILVAAWRAMMDNAGDSSGANVVMSKGVQPADGKWEITGKKLWNVTGEQQDVQKAFQQFQIANNQQDLQAIIELALRFIDMETNLPMIFSGEKGELPETLGATNILVDSNNVALRARVKLWDDRITRPHLTRYYDWNMQYSEKEEIKGDYNVDPRGTSVLLERDQQAQSIEEILALRGDPDLKIMVDWEKALSQFLSARNLDVMLPEAKIAENRKKAESQPPPMDPSLEAAKIRSEAELQKAQLVQEADMAELEFKAQEAELNRQHESQIELMKRDVKMMELSSATGMALDKIKAQLSEVSMKLKTQVSLAKDKDVKPAEQVATPVAEPAGRAPEGQAFQK